MKILILLRVQILLLALLTLVNAMTAAEIIPSSLEMVAIIQDFFRSYGSPAVGAISFIENIVGFNAYFPGSVVILIAMAMTAGDVEQAVVVFLFIYLPTIPAHNVNYFLGRMGFASGSGGRSLLERSRGAQRGWAWIFLFSFWHPHFTALSCVAAGAKGVSYREFMIRLLPIGFFWNVFWGVLMYNLGGLVGAEVNFMPILLGYIIIWSIYDYWKYRRHKASEVIAGSPSVGL